jgi:hypothetical protein
MERIGVDLVANGVPLGGRDVVRVHGPHRDIAGAGSDEPCAMAQVQEEHGWLNWGPGVELGFGTPCRHHGICSVCRQNQREAEGRGNPVSGTLNGQLSVL